MDLTNDAIYGGGVGKGSNFSDFDQAELYLGKPNPAYQNTNAYSRARTTNYDLPEAYRGRNATMERRVALAYLQSESDWETVNAAPWVYMQDLTIEWEVKEIGRELLENVPHEGTSRYMQQASYIERAALGRSGLSFKMELDFFRTDRGRENYNDNIRQLAQAVQRTANLNTVYALLDCKSYEQMWIQKYGRANVDFMQRMNEEVSNYCCSIKGERQMDVLVQKHINLLRSHGHNPNILVLWPGAGMWFDVIGPSMDTLVHSIGKNDNLVEKRGVSAKESFRGIPLFEAREYTHQEVNAGIHNLQLLARSRSVGEYYVMSTDAWRHSSPHSRQEFRTSDRDIFIYNENIDDWDRISFVEAFKHGGLFDGDSDDSKYSKVLVALLKAWKNKHYDFSSDNLVNSGGVKGTKDGRRPPHWLFHQIAGEVDKKQVSFFGLVTHLGQIHSKWISDQDWKRSIETVQDMLDGGDHQTRLKHQELIDSARRIVKEMQTHEYGDGAFWDKIVANDVEVEDTPDDLEKQWDQSVKGLKETPQGSLKLPSDETYRGKYPPGYDNFPGFAEIATHEFSNDEYSTIAKEIRPIVDFIKRLAETLRELFPNSDALNPAHRKPWFHTPQAATVLFDMLVPEASVVPIFVAIKDNKGGHKTRDLETPIAAFIKDIGIVNENGYNGLTPEEYLNLTKIIPDAGKSSQADAYFRIGVNGKVATIEKFKNYLKDTKNPDAIKNEFKSLVLKGVTTLENNKRHDDFKKIFSETKFSEDFKDKGWVRTPLTISQKLFESLPNTAVIRAGKFSDFGQTPIENSTNKGKKLIQTKSRRDSEDEKLHNVFLTIDNSKLRRKRLATDGYFASQISRKIGAQTKGGKAKQTKVSPIEEVDEDDNRFGDEDDEEDVFLVSSKSKKLKSNIGASISKKRDIDYPEDSKEHDYIPQDWTLSFHNMYQKCTAYKNSVASAIGGTLCMTRCDSYGAWKALFDNNVFVPIWILLARANITHRVYSGILMEGGIQTAMNAYSHTNLMLGSDVKTKMFEGNYTTYMRTIVKNQEKVTIIEDIHPANYIGGHGVEWINQRDEFNFVEEQGNNKRNAKSLIAIVEPIQTEKVSLPIISLAGRVENQNYHEQDKDGYHFNSSEFVHVRFGLKDYPESDINVQGSDTFPMLTERPNFNLFQGTQYSWNPATRTFSNYRVCQGHLGRDGSQPGAASSWNGAKQRLPTFKPQEHVLV